MKIGVLCGGNSSEHEISIISALDIIRNNLEYKFLYLTKSNELYYIKNPTIDNILNLKGKKISFKSNGFKGINLDFVILTVHGKNSEDLMGGILDFYNIPYLGSPIYPSIIAMDKELTHLKLKSLGIDSIKKQVIRAGCDYKINRFPVIVKPARSGSSIGISVAHNMEEIKKSLEIAHKEDKKAIVEPYIERITEFCAAFYYDNKVKMSRVEVIDKKNEIFAYDDKYRNRAEDFTHIYLNDDELIGKLYSVGEKIYENFEFEDIIRIDFIYSDNKIYVNEINSLPGSLGLYLFEDKSILNKLIKNKYRHYCKKKETSGKIDYGLIELNSKK